MFMKRAPKPPAPTAVYCWHRDGFGKDSLFAQEVDRWEDLKRETIFLRHDSLDSSTHVQLQQRRGEGDKHRFVRSIMIRSSTKYITADNECAGYTLRCKGATADTYVDVRHLGDVIETDEDRVAFDTLVQIFNVIDKTTVPYVATRDEPYDAVSFKTEWTEWMKTEHTIAKSSDGATEFILGGGRFSSGYAIRIGSDIKFVNGAGVCAGYALLKSGGGGDGEFAWFDQRAAVVSRGGVNARREAIEAFGKERYESRIFQLDSKYVNMVTVDVGVLPAKTFASEVEAWLKLETRAVVLQHDLKGPYVILRSPVVAGEHRFAYSMERDGWTRFVTAYNGLAGFQYVDDNDEITPKLLVDMRDPEATLSVDHVDAIVRGFNEVDATTIPYAPVEGEPYDPKAFEAQWEAWLGTAFTVAASPDKVTSFMKSKTPKSRGYAIRIGKDVKFVRSSGVCAGYALLRANGELAWFDERTSPWNSALREKAAFKGEAGRGFAECTKAFDARVNMEAIAPPRAKKEEEGEGETGLQRSARFREERAAVVRDFEVQRAIAAEAWAPFTSVRPSHSNLSRDDIQTIGGLISTGTCNGHDTVLGYWKLSEGKYLLQYRPERARGHDGKWTETGSFVEEGTGYLTKERGPEFTDGCLTITFEKGHLCETGYRAIQGKRAPLVAVTRYITAAAAAGRKPKGPPVSERKFVFDPVPVPTTPLLRLPLAKAQPRVEFEDMGDGVWVAGNYQFTMNDPNVSSIDVAEYKQVVGGGKQQGSNNDKVFMNGRLV